MVSARDVGEPELGVPVLEDLPDPAGRAVLVRATLDLPLGSDLRQPMAERRARGLGATLRWLVERGARVTVCGDTGARDPDDERERLAHIQHVVESVSPAVTVAETAAAVRPASEDPALVAELVRSHDMFVNDTLQWSYLPMPSLMLTAQTLPSAVGRTLEGDLRALRPLMEDPVRPFVAVLGGDRSFQRLHGLEGLVLRADTVLVGGAMALPMLQALGKQPAGPASDEFLWECREIYGLASRVLHQVVLPLDLVWAAPDGSVTVTAADARAEGEVVDIGPLTRLRFADVVEGAGSILWAGALGRVEDPRFTEGSLAVAAPLSGTRGPVVVGGEALVSLLEPKGMLPDSVQVISATDSAIELLKNGDLPALSPLRGRRDRVPGPAAGKPAGG